MKTESTVGALSQSWAFPEVSTSPIQTMGTECFTHKMVKRHQKEYKQDQGSKKSPFLSQVYIEEDD